MTSKFTTAMIIMTVAALCAALAFQYMEMETFGLPATLKERFFSDEVSQVAPVTDAAPQQEAAPENL